MSENAYYMKIADKTIKVCEKESDEIWSDWICALCNKSVGDQVKYINGYPGLIKEMVLGHLYNHHPELTALVNLAKK